MRTMVWGLVLDLTDFACPDEFTSIFGQESLILTLVAESNWIRILRKNQLRSTIHPASCGGLRQAGSCCKGGLTGLNGPFYSLLPWGC